MFYVNYQLTVQRDNQVDLIAWLIPLPTAEKTKSKFSSFWAFHGVLIQVEVYQQ